MVTCEVIPDNSLSKVDLGTSKLRVMRMEQSISGVTRILPYASSVIEQFIKICLSKTKKM